MCWQENVWNYLFKVGYIILFISEHDTQDAVNNQIVRKGRH